MKHIIPNSLIISAGLVLLVVSLTGCANVRDNVPSTRFVAWLGGKPCTFDGPKYLKADLIKFEVTTNGTVSLTISNIQANMNPEVITMTGEAFVKMQDANTRMVEKIAAGTGTLAGTAATVAAKP
jgi:hypothetical protein